MSVSRLRILVACEFSGVVRRAFAALGHDAWSCDLLPAEDGSPNHFQCDVRTLDLSKYDLLGGHPPCTFLTNAGVRHLHSVPSRNGVLPKIHGPARFKAMQEAADFFAFLYHANVPSVYIENPVMHGYARDYLASAWKVPSYNQLIQPWMFGHGETKATCLWLRNLPLLQPTHRRDDLFCAQEPTAREARIHKMSPSADRSKLRSITFEGIAKAMAAQWGNLSINKTNP